MSKLGKLVNNPTLFFKDMVLKRLDLLNPEEKAIDRVVVKKPIAPRTIASKTVTKKPVAKKSTSSAEVIPSWYNSTIAFDANLYSKDVYLYLPWIPEHGDALVKNINKSDHYEILPFPLIKNHTDNEVRRSALRYARENPDIYRKLLIRALSAYKNDVRGFIFTLDWAPVMRILVDVCRELEIPTILIPHESVFANRNMYYVDPTSLASVPKVDLVLSWGDLQTDIYTERGYPIDRIEKVGAPKFDIYKNYKPTFTREQFCHLFNLDVNKKTILFAAQPLDSQLDTKIARESQRQAISDLVDYCLHNNMQIILRTPPSKDNILDARLTAIFNNSDYAVIDDANFYLVSPTEAIYHADYTVSVNSTMLFEAVLMGRYSFSTKYVEFEQIWQNVGIPAVKNATELSDIIKKMENGEWSLPEHGLQWAAEQFGVGVFDGQASQRIIERLNQFTHDHKQQHTISYGTAKERIIASQNVDVVGILAPSTILQTSESQFKKLVGAKTLINLADTSTGSKCLTDLKKLGSVDAFFQWGIKNTAAHRSQRSIAKRLGKPVFVIEEAFLQADSSNSSIVLDDKTAHYDETQISRLEMLLDSDRQLSESEYLRAKELIQKIVDNRISKYNKSKLWPLPSDDSDKETILIVTENVFSKQPEFEEMLYDVITQHPDAKILVKHYPNQTNAMMDRYDVDGSFQSLVDFYPQLKFINFDVDVYSLFDIVDKVYVNKSNIGFEALMAGKTVHCYGLPFYAGWGLTTDKTKLSKRRVKSRSLEEVFYFSYIELSRYFHPDLQKPVQIEEIVDYIASKH